MKSATQVVTVRNDANILVAPGKEMAHVDVVQGSADDGVSVLVDR